MERQLTIRKVVEPSGNAGHVYLPKDLVGREITIIIPREFEIKDIFPTLKGELDKIMGMYLVGSHARLENAYDSDIDLLVVTDGKCSIKSDRLDVFCIAYDKKKPLSLSAKSMLMEARPILNSRLLEELKKKPFSHKKEFEIGRSALKIARDLLKLSEDEEEVDTGMAYSLVLRMKTYLTYKCLKEGKKYSTKLLLEELGEYTKNPNLFMEVYRAERDDRKIDAKIKKKDLMPLLKALIAIYR